MTFTPPTALASVTNIDYTVGDSAVSHTYADFTTDYTGTCTKIASATIDPDGSGSPVNLSTTATSGVTFERTTTPELEFTIDTMDNNHAGTHDVVLTMSCNEEDAENTFAFTITIAPVTLDAPESPGQDDIETPILFLSLIHI